MGRTESSGYVVLNMRNIIGMVQREEAIIAGLCVCLWMLFFFLTFFTLDYGRKTLKKQK